MHAPRASTSCSSFKMSASTIAIAGPMRTISPATAQVPPIGMAWRYSTFMEKVGANCRKNVLVANAGQVAIFPSGPTAIQAPSSLNFSRWNSSSLRIPLLRSSANFRSSSATSIGGFIVGTWSTDLCGDMRASK